MYAMYTIFVVFAILWNNCQSFVLFENFTSLCSKNVSLYEPNESLQINFNMPNIDSNRNCVSFILWSGQPSFRLVPYITKSAISETQSKPEDNSRVVLSITDISGMILKLQMFGSKPFYLTITPVKPITSNGNIVCPSSYFACGHQMCIHHQLVCDGVTQCANDEIDCFQMPSNYFLLLSFFGVMVTFVFVSFALALYVYFKFYRKTSFLLSDNYKHKFYGTVNGSFESRNSLDSLNSHSTKTSHFYRNIQHYKEYINNNLK